MGRKVWFPVVSGPLAPYAAGFERWLADRGYAPWTVGDRLYQLDQLSRWLERERLTAGELTMMRAAEFASARRRAGLVTWCSKRNAALPLQYLREIGIVMPPAPTIIDDPVERLLADYRRYVLIERGLSQKTIVNYEPVARLFLAGRERAGGLALERLSAADVSMFLVAECPKRSVSGARDLASALRGFLRYLHVAGLIEAPLVWSVPSVADLRDRTLPRGLEPAAVGKLLAGCDRRRTVGDAITRSCCCSRGWGCAAARSPRSGSRMSTGGLASC